PAEPEAKQDAAADPKKTENPTPETPPAETPATEAPAAEAAPSEKPAPAKPAPAPEAPSLTPQQITVLKHLRWLVGEGYIIEFADGRLDAVRVRTITPESKEKPAAEAKSKDQEKPPVTPAGAAKPTEAAPPTSAPPASEAPPTETPAPVTPAPDPVSEHAPDPGLTPQTDPELPADPGLPTDLEP
ncbi:MAG: hypothetical protein P8J87_02380, partial [Verrucomicrobiales bacterium]|nr:hypothetical protein [Verrucomicrobiales bacterium]